jgi:site-specific DNA-methyltransferase (adenine-specific)
LIHGDCLDRLAELEDCSVDAAVTDPPYGLSFMGKHWDYDVPSVEIWQQVFRVLKPGGHLLAFAGTRTQHRMAVNIEDAGFEIRDMIAWVYGSGFPKSLDVSKAIDKAAGAEREVVGIAGRSGSARACMAGDFAGGEYHATAPATPEAQQWAGWGTALKPALEPITVARKPFKGTVAGNVLEHGTGAININGCRVAHSEPCRMMQPSQANIDNPSDKCRQDGRREAVLELKPEGRWPANLIHDGSDDVVGLFPEAGGGFGTRGSAARFFYCAKASKAERGKDNPHPTVKPLALMRYLCRLVTPPGGLVLDPFMGTGTTGIAALEEGFRFIGIEREENYLEVARLRLATAGVPFTLT